MSDMQPYHREILSDIESYVAEKNIPLDPDGSRYVGTTKPQYLFYAADFRAVYGGFVNRHPDLTASELVALLDSLSQGATYNEFIGVGILLSTYAKLRATLTPGSLERWLEHAEGWAEVDTICQSTYSASEMLANWDAWETLLVDFTSSPNIHKRRASLVLLTRPLRESDDPRLAQLAFATVERLKGETDILITKAVSWLLRSLVKHHPTEVQKYLETQADTLPKIAVRETRNKLAGGVKKKKLI